MTNTIRIFNKTKKIDRMVVLLVSYLFSLELPVYAGLISNDNKIYLFYWQIICLLIASLYLIIHNVRNNQNKMSRNTLVISILYIILQIILSISLITNSNSSPISIGSQMVVAIYFCIFLGISNSKKLSPRDLLVFNSYYVIFALFACVYNVAVNFNSVIIFSNIINTYDYSFSSFYLNRNTFGLIAGIGLLVLIANWREIFSKSNSIFKILSLLILSSGLMLSMSRGALLFTILASVFYFVGTNKLRGALKVFSMIIITLSLMVSIFGQDFIISNYIRPDYGITGRDVLQEFGIDYFMNHNVFIGSGFNEPIDALSQKYDVASFHNLYIYLLVTGGLLQLLFYSILFIWSFRNSFKIYKYSKKSSVFYISVLISYLVYSMAESVQIFQSDSLHLILSIYLILLPMYTLNYFNKLTIKKAGANYEE